MTLFLLDAGGAGLFYVVISIGLLFLAMAIVIEALVMMFLKYNPFKKALLQSSIVNLLTVIIGFVLISFRGDIVDINTGWGFITMFLVTTVVEGILLFLMNKGYPVNRTLLVTLVMNIATYLLLFLVTQFVS